MTPDEFRNKNMKGSIMQQLTPQELKFLQSPLSNMDKNTRAIAQQVWDKRNQINWDENEAHRAAAKAKSMLA